MALLGLLCRLPSLAHSCESSAVIRPPSQVETCLTKILRADHHFKELEKGIRAFVEDETYETVHKANGDTGEYWIELKLPAPDPLLGIVLGDVVTNLHSALEYLAWKLVCFNRNGVEPDKPRDVSFPITSSCEADFDNLDIVRKGLLTDDQITAIKGYQPYIHGENAAGTPIAQLKSLADTNKHRSPPVLAVGIPKGNRPVFGNPTFVDCELPFLESFYVEHGMLDNDAVLAWWRFPSLGPNPRVDMDIEMSLDVALEDGTVIFGGVEHMRAHVIGIVRDIGGQFFPPESV